jgi:UDP-N-acetylmuramate dehydrogenase
VCQLALVDNPADLVKALESVRDTKIKSLLIGGGSNVVFPDGDCPADLVVVNYLDQDKLKHFPWLEMNEDLPKLQLEVWSAAPLWKLVEETARLGLAGLERLAGIPGTVGGAIYGNAGAYGKAIGDHLVAVEIFDGQATRWLKKEECGLAYRDSIFKKNKNWAILRARLALEKGDSEVSLAEIDATVKDRWGKYDPKAFCAGSFFKNIEVKNVSPEILAEIPPEKIKGGKLPAGYLLEQCAAKGQSVGGIRVPDWHANFLINDGTGTTADLRQLADSLKKQVKKRFGIELEEEVQFVM